ncbi:MAG: glutaredoxin domain-containing protein [Thermodesulfobacteriota bacterium]
MPDNAGATCPKCGYTRKPDDFAPAWQCPQCGIVYEKHNKSGTVLADSGSDRPSSFGGKEPVKSRESSTALTGWLLFIIAAIVISAGLYGYFSGADPNDQGSMSDNGAANYETDETASNEVVLYTARGCRYCDLAKDFLIKHDVAFIEYNINESEENLKKFNDLRGRGVPLIFVGKNRISGWDQEVMENVLKDAGLI